MEHIVVGIDIGIKQRTQWAIVTDVPGIIPTKGLGLREIARAGICESYGIYCFPHLDQPQNVSGYLAKILGFLSKKAIAPGNPHQVFVTVDAPMWIPKLDSPGAFKSRFPLEGGKYAWYLQSGAAASMKALALLPRVLDCAGMPALSLLLPGCQPDNRALNLCESFVAGKD